MKIRIATWNIAAARKLRSLDRFDYDEHEDLDYFTDKLRNLNPDVVCLQEVHVKEHDSLANRISERLHMPYVSETSGCPSHIDPNYKMTTAILTNIPSIAQEAVQLPYPTFELRREGKVLPPYDRYVQCTQFKDFTVATMHSEPLGMFGLQYESGDGKTLAQGIDKLLIKHLVRRPLIFAADFNMNSVTKALPLACHAFGLREVLPNDQATKPSGGRPDHILVSPEWRVLDYGIIQTRSDHFLCWSDLQLLAN